MSITTSCLFPRLEKLRSAHNDKPPSLLTGKLDHISKKRSVKSGIYYKVTICKDCSDSNEPVYLGCFTDLESAILVNDVYEMLSHRTIHVHLLTSQDMKFVNELTVSRSWRSQVVEVNLMQLLKENISRSEIGPFTQSTDVNNNSSVKSEGSISNNAAKDQKRGPSAVYRRVMANRFLQLLDSNTNLMKALCCVPQAACDINPVLIALTKLSVELHSSTSTQTVSTSKFYNVKNLEAILTSATACGLISTSLIQLLSASCLEGDCDDTNSSEGGMTRGPTAMIRDSLGPECILSLSDITKMKTNMIQAISCKQHIAVWGDIMGQLLRINHTVALKCEKDLHLPVWEPAIPPATNETTLQSIWEMSLLHYNMVQELIGGLHAGAEIVASAETLSVLSNPSTSETQPYSSVSNDTYKLHSLLDLGRCTVVLTLSGLGTAVLLNHQFGILPAAHLNSVFEHFVKWESLIRTTNISNETVVIPFALYECIKLEVFSTYLDGELKTTKNPVDIRPQLLLAAQMATITLRMLNKEKEKVTKSSTGGGGSSSVSSSSSYQSKKSKPTRIKNHQPLHYYKELNQNDAISRHMFGIKNELALRINISLMCLAVATGDLSCMGTVNVTEAVIIAVHTLLNKLRKWLDITEGGCGILFAQTQLSLYKCVCMEEELATQLRENNPEHSDRLSLEFEMVREISSLAEQVLRCLSTRFTLSKMLLAQLSKRCETDGATQRSASAVRLSSHDPPSSLSPVKRQRQCKRARADTDNTNEEEEGGEGVENDKDDITDIISLYSQSCRSISSYARSTKAPKPSIAALSSSVRRRKVSALSVAIGNASKIRAVQRTETVTENKMTLTTNTGTTSSITVAEAEIFDTTTSEATPAPSCPATSDLVIISSTNFTEVTGTTTAEKDTADSVMDATHDRKRMKGEQTLV